VLLIYVNELWNGHFHLVRAPDQIGFLELHLILNTLCTLIKLNRLFNWVRNLRKSFLLFAIAELFLLNLDLVGYDHITLGDFQSLNKDRYDEARYSILLFVVDADLDMGALIDFVSS